MRAINVDLTFRGVKMQFRRFLILGCSFLFSFNLHAAALRVFGQMNLTGTAILQETYSFDKAGLTDPSEAVLSETRSNAQTLGQVISSADYGVLKTSGRAISDLDQFQRSSAEVGSTAAWIDQLMVTSGDLSGGGFAAVQIVLDGLTGATADSANFATLQFLDVSLSLRYGRYLLDANARTINVAGGGSFNQTSRAGYINGDGSFTTQIETSDQSIFRTYDLLVPIQFGVTSALSVQLSGAAQIAATTVGTLGGGEAWYDLGNSLYWGGISYLLDSAGNRISDFSVLSDSGADYSKSYVPVSNQVPEPPSLLLIALGVVLALFVRRVRLVFPQFLGRFA